jgi:hypothetical protein
MMNMIELQNKLKNFSQEQLVGMMQQPSGDAPQFMVLGEITRRQKMQQEATKAPTQSVAQEAVSAAGVPQGGIADMARTLAPQTNVAQNTGAMSAPPQDMPSAPQGPAPMAAAPQGIARMASGGVIKMQAAGKIDYARYRELARRLIRNDSFSPEELKELEQIKGTSAFMDAEYAAEYELANPDFRRVESSAPTPVFDATVEAPSLNQAPAADIIPVYNDAKDLIKATYAEPTYDSAAPQMPVPPKTDSMPQGPRPSTTGSTQVNIAGNIYAVLGDGSVVDQMGRTPPPPVAELARQKAGTPAAQFTTQQQFQDAQNLANRIGANSGENAVLPSENLLMGGGREGTPFLNQAPAADTAMYGGGYDPRTNVPAAPSGLAALSPETMPTVGGPAAPPPRPEFIPWDTTGKNKENFGRFGQYEAGMDYLLGKARDTINKGNMLSFDASPTEEGTATLDRITADHLASRREEAAMLGNPNLDPSMRRALENRIFLRENFANIGADTLDAGLGLAAKYGAAPITDLAAGAVSAFSPTSAASMYDFANRIRSGADQVTENKPTTANSIEEAAITSALDASKVRKSITPNIDNITDEELAKYTNKRPQPRPKDLFAPTTDNAREGGASKGTGTGSGSGSGSGSGGSSNYETKLLEMLSRQEANAKSDKWMALAQAGMSLMQGGTGSFGGDLGRAGQTGLAALQGSRASNDKSQLDILGAIENSKLKREAIAASAAKGSAYDVNDYVKLLADLATQKQTIMADPSTTNAEKELAVKDITIEEARIRELMFPGRASSTPKPQTFDATKPPGIIRQGIDAVRGFVTG